MSQVSIRSPRQRANLDREVWPQPDPPIAGFPLTDERRFPRRKFSEQFTQVRNTSKAELREAFKAKTGIYRRADKQTLDVPVAVELHATDNNGLRAPAFCFLPVA